MTSAPPSRTKLIAAYAAICIIWGSTFLAIKYAITTMPPFAMAATRFLVAGILLYAWARTVRRVDTTGRQWVHAWVLGTLMLCGGNGAVVWAEQYVASGVAALTVAAIPLLVVVIDWVRPGGVRPHGAVLIGVVVGLAGLGLLIGPAALNESADISLPAAIVLVLGSLSWSLATVFGKRAAVPGFPPLTSAMQLLGGGASLVIVSLVAGEGSRIHPSQISTIALGSLAYLIVFGSIVAFSAYSWLLRVAPPARTATYAFVNPVVAMLLGAFVGEVPTARTIAAAVVIIGGVALITMGVARGAGGASAPGIGATPAAKRA